MVVSGSKVVCSVSPDSAVVVMISVVVVSGGLVVETPDVCVVSSS